MSPYEHGYDDVKAEELAPSVQAGQEPDGFHCDGDSFDDCEACQKGWCGFPDTHCEHRDPRDPDDDGGNDFCTHCGCCPCNSCMYARHA